MALRTDWAPQDGNPLDGGLNALGVAANRVDDGTGTRILTMNSPATGSLHLIRVGRDVTIRHNSIAGALTVLYTLPLGFRPVQTLTFGALNSAGVTVALTLTSAGQLIKTSGTAYLTSAWQEHTFITDNAWPATLPGVEG